MDVGAALGDRATVGPAGWAVFTALDDDELAAALRATARAFLPVLRKKKGKLKS